MNEIVKFTAFAVLFLASMRTFKCGIESNDLAVGAFCFVVAIIFFIMAIGSVILIEGLNGASS